MPTVPNQPSEASAHFMFELAKTVLTKAGGNSSTSLFTQPTSTNNTPNGPHRNLHLCAFQIGLYALGLHNCVSPNWLSRTYSSHVSWITGWCSFVWCCHLVAIMIWCLHLVYCVMHGTCLPYTAVTWWPNYFNTKYVNFCSIFRVFRETNIMKIYFELA